MTTDENGHATLTSVPHHFGPNPSIGSIIVSPGSDNLVQRAAWKKEVLLALVDVKINGMRLDPRRLAEGAGIAENLTLGYAACSFPKNQIRNPDVEHWLDEWPENWITGVEITNGEKEMNTDTAMHCFILGHLFRFPNATNKTLKLLTGDGNDNDGRVSTVHVIRSAVSVGWKVEVWTWADRCSKTLKKLAVEIDGMTLHYFPEESRMKIWPKKYHDAASLQCSTMAGSQSKEDRKRALLEIEQRMEQVALEERHAQEQLIAAEHRRAAFEEEFKMLSQQRRAAEEAERRAAEEAERRAAEEAERRAAEQRRAAEEAERRAAEQRSNASETTRRVKLQNSSTLRIQVHNNETEMQSRVCSVCHTSFMTYYKGRRDVFCNTCYKNR